MERITPAVERTETAKARFPPLTAIPLAVSESPHTFCKRRTVMMIDRRYLRRLAIPIVCASAWGCGSSKELSRDKALELLRAAEPALLRDVTTDNLGYATLRISKGDRVSCETAKRLAFSEQLASAGIVSHAKADYPEKYIGTGIQPLRPGGTQYEFRPIDSTLASPPPYENIWGSWLILTMAKPQISEVTGIRQEGTSAVGEALVTYEPTPVFDALVKTETLFAQSGQADRQCKELYSLPDPRTESFRFERYDDGWRLAENR